MDSLRPGMEQPSISVTSENTSPRPRRWLRLEGAERFVPRQGIPHVNALKYQDTGSGAEIFAEPFCCGMKVPSYLVMSFERTSESAAIPVKIAPHELRWAKVYHLTPSS